MNLAKMLLIFSFLVFTGLVMTLIRWLLNQPNDWLVIAAGLSVVLYLWITIKTKAFTKNPFN